MKSLAVQSFGLIFLAWFSIRADAYSNGLVTSACSTMMPDHGASAQVSSSPYILNLAKSTYSPGEKITITLTSTSGSTPFKGFLIQARSGTDSTPLGSFQVTTTDAQTLTCTTAASAVSHRSMSQKTSLQVTWVAPTSTTADIQIRATVVQAERTFWTNVSSKLSYMTVPSNTASSTTSTTTTTSGSTVSTTTTTSSSTVNTTTTTSSSTSQKSQAFLVFCVVVAIYFLVQ
ncbi:putative ferric-chelate reductase 1 isoform 2-T2 [Mantella aurantiaca]